MLELVFILIKLHLGPHFVVDLHRLFAEIIMHGLILQDNIISSMFCIPCYMPTHSGTQYHIRGRIFEMDPNIASIAKLLEDLSTRFGSVEKELRSNRERLDRLERETIENVNENGPRVENRTPSYIVQSDHDEMNLRKIKLEAPTFDGQLDPQFFLNWTSDMDHYFDWYNMSDEMRI